MFLRTLTLRGYGIFDRAEFNLCTDVDRPIVLLTGNNGAGKTSFLEALRVALHGRRAFDVPLSEAEYLRTMTSRFHSPGDGTGASVELEFDYVDLHATRRVVLERGWRRKGQGITETLQLTLDGQPLAVEDAEDLLANIIPPEIARYFFFDGERIRELAEWDVEDESALFAAVADLLGLGILDQLRSDLERLSAAEGRVAQVVRGVATALADAERRERMAVSSLKAMRGDSRKIRGAFERARAEVRRVGAMRQDEIAELERELAELGSERRSLLEEAHRAAADVLPLLCARTLRRRFGAEIEARKEIEDRFVVSQFVEDRRTEITALLRGQGLHPSRAKRAVEGILTIARGSLIPVSDIALPDLSRNDAVWMRRVIERELPEMAIRNSSIVERLRFLEQRIVSLEDRRRSIPVNDLAGENALNELERRQRDLIEHEASLISRENELLQARTALENARAASKDERFERFRAGRLRIREQAVLKVLDALPILSKRLQASKEKRFSRYLESALRELWHKTDRLTGVDVAFADRRILLMSQHGEINKRDLSAGEKQLFAIAFIHALSRLSGRHIPFVIDTPLGRLDHEHRRRFVADFIPNASHQVILLSTDTEIVGPLYQDLVPLLAHHYELSNFNGGLTAPVEVIPA